MANHRFSYLFEVESDPPAYLWTGDGQLEYDSKTYLGAGHILSLPDIKQLINGVSERLEVSFSGVNDETLRLAVDDRESVYLAPTRIGRISFDADWQIDGDAEWLWSGRADVLTPRSSPSENGRTRSISIGFSSGDTMRSNPRASFFTDASQRQRSGDDAFFSHVGQINAGIVRKFGPK